MATLNPAPASLGLASPALGPWFRDGTAATPNLGAPASDLSVAVTLPANMEWRAPAGGTAAYAVATATRPAVLAPLRAAGGGPAFTTGSLVVLFSLLPEAELRLAALSNSIPTPDGTVASPGAAGRPPVRALALEVPAASAGTIAAVEQLREADLPSQLTTDDDRAAYLGLTVAGGGLGNAAAPVAELHRPGTSPIIVKNRTSAGIATSLWAFDDRGRALDPGAVAAWWAFLSTPAIFDNLWALDDTDDQRTATVTAGRTVLFCTPHEGPLPAAHRPRLTLGGLTAIAGDLYTVGASPSVQVSAPPTPDLMPLPRLALLPNGAYGAAGAPGTAPFAGWTGAGFPASLTRDFARIAVADLESHLAGVDRGNATQNDPNLRVNVLRNTAATPFLATNDPAAAAVTGTLAAGAAAVAMTPVADTDWGALTAPSFGSGALPDALAFTVHALRGEGTPAGATVGGQRVVVRFPAGSLPASAWVRVWPHGLDTATGLRFRQDGGGGRADASGRAFAVTALADGTAAPTDPDAEPMRMSFDALVVTDTTARYYIEQRFDRPALVAGARETLPTLPGNLPGGLTAWICEQGATLARGGAQLGGGQTLLAVPADEAAGTYALVDPATLDDTDVAAGTLRNAVSAGDQVIVTMPAFADTPEGDVVDASGPVGTNGAAILRRTRNGLVDDVTQFGRPLPLMERREVAAIDPAGGTGVVAAAPGRATAHESIPAQLGHPGMPGTAEIHGTGGTLAGPLAGALAMLMRERSAATLPGFVGLAQRPVTIPTDPGGTTAFGAVLETLSRGVTGDASVRAYVAITEAAGGFSVGQSWLDLKNAIEGATGIDLDGPIDTATFDDDALAAAVDRVVLKTRDGAAQAATAIAAAIGRAEDLVYLETPAIDPLTASSGAIDIVGALTARLTQRPGLAVLLCVPEKFLPGQPGKLEAIRKAGVGAALKVLLDAAPGNVVLFTPTAGSGRPLHAASTTVIVDDAFLVTGPAHLWRRGLTFDSSLALALFDEAVVNGRPAAIRAARRQLLGDRLAITPALVPDDPRQLREVLGRLNAAGGLMRVAPGVYPAQADATSTADRDAWNPDGTPGGTSDWYLFLASLGAGPASDINNAIR
ncbi:MAG TPA: hypothetical protein VES19_13865 [Candidatus Limnocylindrales bacterium]|nr:hypothetical protein [Candidatus Limnocylindrales bacterium]